MLHEIQLQWISELLIHSTSARLGNLAYQEGSVYLFLESTIKGEFYYEQP